MPQILSKSFVDEKDYIALVKIKKILPINIDSPGIYNGEHYFKIVVEEITNYKGGHFTELLVKGGHDKFDTKEFCDLDINELEEWIVFSQYLDNVPILCACSLSRKYKQSDGFRDWQFRRGFTEIDFLDQYYQRQVPANLVRNGEASYFFPNGKLEKLEHYKNGKLDGSIEYYFPSGKLYGKGYYHKGKLDKTLIWYYEDGQVETTRNYYNGIEVDSSIYYISTNSGMRPQMIRVYNKKGVELLFQEYSGITDHYLWKETIYDPVTKIEKVTYYFNNDKTKETYSLLNNKYYGDYIVYDEEGNVMSKLKYDANGNTVQ